ncbi:MAG TPA: MBL fold metallo-hydrolase [Candidatus Sumerlaeota bacterium]|nr:MAG: ribonuclease Z [candidate division BRC1 bacterium ADurb.Bin183]HOE62550.1 MBL fold metallo-hydrolase [Candidatus Sumerlaeota bacterium]HRR31828.1 MBL fold metallo-hydrolase [Candidatus Sumerlaeia bacterium]HON49310.1 MBL fold metallo-hydrolase [Candidatus Sumerlaeota bacterium]HOR64942.1 MBL fold metallo-hydrolase [Candidatus Sumerlaeota bacterium]
MKRICELVVSLVFLAMAVSMVFAAPVEGDKPEAGDSAQGKAVNSRTVVGNCYPTRLNTQRFTYFNNLKTMKPWRKDMKGRVTGTKLEPNEMRITFMGSANPQARRAQNEMSIFVEVGWDNVKQQPLDQFIFDCGLGVTANYQACGVGFSRMDKIFLNHLHADHFNDLIQVYCFGPSGDRKSPQYVWGPSPSGVPNPGMNPLLDPSKFVQNLYADTPAFYNDGLTAFCQYLREMSRWHTESFAFQNTAYMSYPFPNDIQTLWGLPSLPVPVSDDPPQDAYALIPIELDWTKTGLDADGKPTGDNIAYNNAATGAKVMHYPVIHARKGSLGYKLEWTPPGASKPLTMVYSSDTKPETNSINHAINKDENGVARGVDIFIHEMVPPAEIWAMLNQGLSKPGNANDPVWQATVRASTNVQNSSHTPQGAFGYMLSQIYPRPRLTVATHFPTSDDTVACALKSVRAHCPDIRKQGDKIIWSFDLMVLRVFPDRILQRRAVVNDFTYNPPTPNIHQDLYPAKYHTNTGSGDAYIQLELQDQILSTEEGGANGAPTYRKDGY